VVGNRWGHPHRYRPCNPTVTNGRVRMLVYVDEETFAEIDAAAKARDVTVSSQTAFFLDIGIETMALEDEERARG
jgi:hypothetical protein